MMCDVMCEVAYICFLLLQAEKSRQENLKPPKKKKKDLIISRVERKGETKKVEIIQSPFQKEEGGWLLEYI